MGLIRYGMEGLLDQLVGLVGPLEKEVADGEVVHLRVDETAIGIIGGTDHRLAADIERRVHEHGTTGAGFKALQDGMEIRILLRVDSLYAGGVVDMGNGRQF